MQVTLITRDAKDLPAILTNSGNPYFEMFKDAIENELAQCKKISWNEPLVAPAVGKEMEETFLSSISGLPRTDGNILEAAKILSQAKGSRYAR